jgi:pyridoxine/pyridoxamine 5'-phosphate oxidase
MPGYGVLPADQGSGLMAWPEAERRLALSHDYWCATVRPDGRPHVMPVWGVWLDGGVWFSSGMRSRKARNLARDPHCTLTTDDARNPVVVDGVAVQVTHRAGIEAFVAAVNGKYGGGVSMEFLDPQVNGTFAVTPRTVFGITEADFAGSPTRWRFPSQE